MRNLRGKGTLLGGCDWTEKMGLGVEEKKEDVEPSLEIEKQGEKHCIWLN